MVIKLFDENEDHTMEGKEVYGIIKDLLCPLYEELEGKGYSMRDLTQSIIQEATGLCASHCVRRDMDRRGHMR